MLNDCMIVLGQSAGYGLIPHQITLLMEIFPLKRLYSEAPHQGFLYNHSAVFSYKGYKSMFHLLKTSETP